MLIYRRDLLGRAVLIIGQGPSAWFLEGEEEQWLLEVLRANGLIVVVCNRGYSTFPNFDFCFAQDPPLCSELFVCRVHERGAVVVPDGAWLDWMHQGNQRPAGLEDGLNFYTLGAAPLRSATGVLAFHAMVYCRASSITLAGFDGSSDGRNRFLGQEGYRTKPTRKATYIGWESHMKSIVRQSRAAEYRTRLFHAPDTDDEHHLDSAFDRVDSGLFEHLKTEIELCQMYGSVR